MRIKLLVAALSIGALTLAIGCSNGVKPVQQPSYLPVSISPSEVHLYDEQSAIFTASGGDPSSYQFEFEGVYDKLFFRLEPLGSNQVRVTLTTASLGGKAFLRVRSRDAEPGEVVIFAIPGPAPR